MSAMLWNKMVKIIEQEDVVQVIFKTATGKTITLDAEAGNTKDDEAMDAKASDDDDYQLKLHVIHAGVAIAVCNPYCEADGMTLAEIRDAFEEGFGRYLYKDGYGWKFNMPRQILKKLIQDKWLLNGEVVGISEGIVKPCDSLEVHMVFDADVDSESCRSDSDSEHGDKTITLDAEASDEGIGYSFVKGNKVVWRGMVRNCFDCDTFCDEVAVQVPKELNFHFEDEFTWLMYVNNITGADCGTALLCNHDVIEFRFNDKAGEARSTIEPDIHFKIE